MKLSRPIYVRSAAQISIQQPLCDDWIDAPVKYDTSYNEAIDPQFREFLSAGEARRLGKIMKRAVATSAVALREAGLDCPDAVVTATGLGCVKNTELFLTDLCNNGEQLLKPTQFMQSTHNTIGSLVAILNHCHGYNVTYAHKGVSMEIAMLDAVMQLSLGYIDNALVGAHDEMTPSYFDMLKRVGMLGADGMVTSGETAVSMVLSTDADGALCRLADMGVVYRPDKSKLDSIFDKIKETHGRIDAVMVGRNGVESNDRMYAETVESHFPESAVTTYKNVFGEGFTASALGIYASVRALQTGRLPECMITRGRVDGLSNILFVNLSDGKDVAYVLFDKNI